MIEPVTCILDRPRRLKWSLGAEARLGSLDRPPGFRDLSSTNPRRAFFALCAHVWAALIPADAADFASYEDLAEVMQQKERQAAAFDGLIEALRRAGMLAEKKTPATAASTGSSSDGPSLSSSSAPPVPPP